jgi:hypothetical protein
MGARDELRATAKARKMPAGMMGLAEGYDPHLLDAMELAKASWAALEEGSVARCWLKADILPPAMQAELKSLHGRGAAAGAVDPALAGLEAAFRALRLGGASAEDEDIAEALLALDIGNGASGAAAAAAVAQRWVQLEEDDDVSEALRADLRDELVAAAAAATAAEAAAAAAAAAAEAAGEEEDNSDDDGGRVDPMDFPAANEGDSSEDLEAAPPYSALAEAFLCLEGYADRTGLTDASALLRMAKMVFLSAHAAVPARQLLIRDFFRPASAVGAAAASPDA